MKNTDKEEIFTYVKSSSLHFLPIKKATRNTEVIVHGAFTTPGIRCYRYSSSTEQRAFHLLNNLHGSLFDQFADCSSTWKLVLK